MCFQGKTMCHAPSATNMILAFFVFWLIPVRYKRLYRIVVMINENYFLSLEVGRRAVRTLAWSGNTTALC